MTEEAVREIFFKNYSGNDLNEELMACLEEIFWETFRAIPEKPERPDDIVDIIFKAQGRIRLFIGMTSGTTLTVSPNYLDYLDFIRGVIIKICSYLMSVYETTDPWFRERFSIENLQDVRSQISSKVESVKIDSNVRNFHTDEIGLYNEFFNIALVALIGRDRFNKFFIEDLNKSMAVLRQCQQETLMLSQINPNTTPS